MIDAARIAELAAREAMKLLQARPTTIAYKGAIDLVTEIDLASEARIRETLERLAPGVPIQGEEGGGVSTGTRWVVDPLDGTINFVHGYPSYSVSIALCEGDAPIVGCIGDPIHDRVYVASRGEGATCNGERISVSDVRVPLQSLGVTGFPNDRRELAAFCLRYVERVLGHTQGVRRSGSAAMDFTAIACGQADFFWEFGLKPWDTAGGAVIVREAGGMVTALDGTDWAPGTFSVLATNGWLHDALVTLMGRDDLPLAE